jgi:nitric oxide reductase
MQQRSMVESIFTKQHIDSMRPQIQKTVNYLLDRLIAVGGAEPFDLVEKFALPVPSYVSRKVPPKQKANIHITNNDLIDDL